MGRPIGSYTEGSMRHRIRVLLTHGRAMSAQEIVDALNLDQGKVRNAIACGVHDGAFKSIRVARAPVRYTLRKHEVEFRVVPPAHAIPVWEGHRQWWQV